MTDPTSSPSHGRGRRWWLIGGGLVATALVVGGFAIWYLVFRDTAPPAVNIDRASESVDSGKSTATTTGDSAGIAGTWTIDPSVGSFSDFTSAFVGYRVNEELAGVGAKTAFGRTPDVTGSLTIAGTTATKAKFEANLATLQSDESQRDNSIRRQSIETDTFPTATFELTKPIDFGSVPADGATKSVDAVGDLTLHGVKKSVTMPLDAKLVNGEIVVTGQIKILFADYGIEKPMSFKVLSIEDSGIMEVQLFFKRS
jgi:polyisoprenoid-binding protein YceI